MHDPTADKKPDRDEQRQQDDHSNRADSHPGYRGKMESLLKEMRFQYTGWLRAQKLIPVNNLKVGTNDIIITSGSATSTSAIRGTQVQLKYLWEKSDYLLQADH